MTTLLIPPGGEQRVFAARLDMLHQTRAFVEEFCAGRGLSADDAARLALIVEELFTNSVVHGYRGDCDEPIVILLGPEQGGTRVVYEDAAPAYDPLARLAAARLERLRPAVRQPVGRLGVLLVAGLSAEARYERAEGRNRLTLTVRSAV